MIEPTSGSTRSTAGSTQASAGMPIGKDGFLKLLVGQLRNQNPLTPMADQEFLGQMTQMTMLEQVTNLAANSARMQDAMGVTQSLGLIGRDVTYSRSDGSTVQGVVRQVTFGEDGKPRLTIDGETGVEPSRVREVR